MWLLPRKATQQSRTRKGESLVGHTESFGTALQVWGTVEHFPDWVRARVPRPSGTYGETGFISESGRWRACPKASLTSLLPGESDLLWARATTLGLHFWEAEASKARP